MTVVSMVIHYLLNIDDPCYIKVLSVYDIFQMMSLIGTILILLFIRDQYIRVEEVRSIGLISSDLTFAMFRNVNITCYGTLKDCLMVIPRKDMIC